MEQTESVVVQVAPYYENHKIREMEAFAWNLQGRQEIRERGWAIGGAGYIDSTTYVVNWVETTVDVYVKLHFVRPKRLPNISKLRALESEYHALPFPPWPGRLLWPVVFTLWGVPGALAMLLAWLAVGGAGMVGVILAGGWIGLGIYWIKSRIRKQHASTSTCAISNKRASEILSEVRKLTSW